MSNPKAELANGHTVKWRLLGGDGNDGVPTGARFTLDPSDPACIPDDPKRRAIMDDLKTLGDDEVDIIRRIKQVKQKLMSDQQTLAGGTCTNNDTFVDAWKEIQSDLDNMPIAAIHECDSEFCPLTRGKTPLRRLMFLVTYLDLVSHTFPKSQSNSQEFVYVSFASGGMGYDMQICRALHRLGVRKLKFVSVELSEGFIPFIVEQAGAGAFEGTASLFTWIDPMFEADSRILTTEKPIVGSITSGVEHQCTEEFKTAIMRRHRWRHMHNMREQMYGVLHILHRIGFDEPSVHLCNNARDLFNQDPTLVGSAHLLVGMDVFDDCSNKSTFADYTWLAQHALKKDGLSSLCTRNGSWNGEVIVVQSIQSEQPDPTLLPDASVVVQMNSVEDLLPRTHERLLVLDAQTPSLACNSLITYCSTNSNQLRRHNLLEE